MSILSVNIPTQQYLPTKLCVEYQIVFFFVSKNICVYESIHAALQRT